MLKRGGVKPISSFCSYISERIALDDISIDDYVSTDNLLKDCQGLNKYDGTPNTTSVVKFHKGDILLSNIRPYLKKIWLADRDGGCNADVLVIRVTENEVLSEYVYYNLCCSSFFDFVMSDVKGIKMPRGNKSHILKYEIPIIPLSEQEKILEQVHQYEEEIRNAKDIIDNCENRKRMILQKYLYS